jgi:hypothetical protein
MGPVSAQIPPQARNSVAQVLDLKGLTPQARLALVGKSQVTRGFFSNRSVPMIIDDVSRLNILKQLPPESYILLGGTIPAALRHGDRIEVEGTFTKSGAADPAHLRGEQTFLKLGPAVAPKVLSASTTPKAVAISAAQLAKFRVSAERFRIKIDKPVHLAPTHYALLVAGGIDFANYFVCMYNDLVINYNMLLGLGYDPKNIIVLNSNGSWTSSQAPCGTIPVNNSATLANLTSAFTSLAGKMRAQDTLYFSTTTHGGSGGTICLWGQTISAATFAGLVNGITNYSQMTFAMESCHSGAIIPALRGPNRIILASCDPELNSWLTPDGNFAPLNWGVVAAASGLTPAGTVVNADGNSDGKISLAEVFNHLRTHLNTTAVQHPHYEDKAAPPDTTAALPQGSTGTFGASKTLH